MSVVEETASTNADLLRAARDGAAHGTVLVADHQTAGRGRQGRAWSAPPGSGLLCSVLVRPPANAILAGATWAVGLSARAACAKVAGVQPVLKWPNDLLLDGRKLAGVLAESLVDAGAVSAVVVGIGLNLEWTAPPPADVAATAITLSDAAGRRVEREPVLRAFLAALAPLLDEWRDAPRALLARYRVALGTLGIRVRAELVRGAVIGVAVDVTEDGALVVEAEDGDVHTLRAADVVHLRDHGGAGPPG